MIDMDLAPTRAEAERDEAERLCALHGHVIGENEDGETVCTRCGDLAMEYDEPVRPEDIIEMIRALPAQEATKSRDYGRGYAQAVKDVLRLLDAR